MARKLAMENNFIATEKTKEYFDRANTESIHKAIQGLRTKYNGEFDASELFKELDQIKPAYVQLTITIYHLILPDSKWWQVHYIRNCRVLR